ncbi:hypothetical protein E2C01_084673 [Portunus trituberculatus]|uniref:Uncharacterized protein n=1 Tax=Portunus trituberculatus TaxID=210409 RepID=A0A5B7J4M6_PORTR|nr:hypothetical protein [Portunus trituberculatus]
MVRVRCVALTHLPVFLPPLIPPCLLVGIGNRSVGKRTRIPWVQKTVIRCPPLPSHPHGHDELRL